MRLNDAPADALPTADATRPKLIRHLRITTHPGPIDWSALVLLGVTVLAFMLRIYNLNWDVNNHLHPDEREIILKAQCLGLQSVQAGCNPVTDPANPHFFAYGSFPLYLLALVAHGLAHFLGSWHGLPTDGGSFDDYDHFTLIGRVLSALFDTGTVLVVGLIARRLAGRWWGVFAAAFVAVTAFEVQLAHFYAVDTVMTFFVTLTLFGALGLAGFQRPHISDQPAGSEPELPKLGATAIWALMTGIAFGLALTSKVSAAPLVVPLLLAFIIRWRKIGLHGWSDVLFGAILTGVTTFLTVAVTMPYLFLDSKEFWAQINQESALAKGTIVFPYTIQFAHRTPYLDQMKNIFTWDLGFWLALAGCAGVVYAIVRCWRRWDDVLLIPLSWIVIYFGYTGSFYTKFSRYQLPIFPMMAVLAAVLLSDLHARVAAVRSLTLSVPAGTRWVAAVALLQRPLAGANGVWRQLHIRRWLAPALAGVTIFGGLFLTLAFLKMYTEPMTRLAASDWIYKNVPQGSVLTDEIWDDRLPLGRPHHLPYEYTYQDLDLYRTPEDNAKAQLLGSQLAQADVIVLASNRLYTSITRVPEMYPMTSNYYHLLFGHKLGFHLVKTFANHPHLGPFQLPDDTADESFSVYDHPTVWIFVRDDYPLFKGPSLSSDQIAQTLLNGVSLPPTSTALASQKTLLLSNQAKADDAATAPLWQTFDPAGLATKLALPLWWLAVELLGLLAFPLAFVALPGLRDRGWGLAKALGVLLLSYLIWLPANLRIVPYDRGTVWLAAVALAGLGFGVWWPRRREMLAFVREHARTIILTEVVTLAAFLIFVAIRSANPDLWHLYRGGEKPMELTFLNGILRSRTLPPLDPWFADGAINYYYFGQFLIATLIQLTGIVPTTAFNLAIPLLFALTISGAISVIGGITRRWWVGVVAGWFLAVAGNLDGLSQFWAQWQQYWAHLPISPFDYWASSRVIPFTINEFPFWSFLYSDLHAHVIDLPIVLLGLGVAASLWQTTFVPTQGWLNGRMAQLRTVATRSANRRSTFTEDDVTRRGRAVDLIEQMQSDHAPPTRLWPTVVLGALALGAMACINTWDAPIYGIIIVVALLVALWQEARLAAMLSVARGWRRWLDGYTWLWVRRVLLLVGGLGVAAIALYLPFYLNFQSFVNGLGPVTRPTDPILFLRLFGVWLFLIGTFVALELADWLREVLVQRGTLRAVGGDAAQQSLITAFVLIAVVTLVVLAGVKFLLLLVIVATGGLLLRRGNDTGRQFAYVLMLAGALVALLVEAIYLRDFLDGGDWERMNTVFKFYYQVWVLWALGAAITVPYLLRRLLDWARPQPTSVADDLPIVMPGSDEAWLYPEAFASDDEAIQDNTLDGAQLGLSMATYQPEDFPEGGTPALAYVKGSTGEMPAVATKARPFTPRRVMPQWLEGSDGGEVVALGLRGAWLVALIVLLFGSTIFFFEGTSVRVAERTQWGRLAPAQPLRPVPSLDGFGYMKTWSPGDAAAITWLNQHVSGAPTILEASGDPYQWYSRVAIYTGLPTVVGWGSHETQQRYPDEIYARQPDISAMYTLGSGNSDLVLNLLHQYHVRYVYVGQLECLTYATHDPQPTFSPTAANMQACAQGHDVIGPLTVFDQFVQQEQAKVVYRTDSVSIWEITG
ncbi:MAG: hypothetical protein H0X24_06915 [Ktedonobacterales bacterium]|nr:hypothetical protein [Ktedonobacterales bacterium]